MSISLRPFRPEDQDFLFRLYASTRMHEIAAFGWPAAQQEAFFRMQFTAQQRWYAATYAQAEHQIVEQDGQPIGRTMVERENTLGGKGIALLVDISLLAEHRGRGIGGKIVRDLIEQCRGDGTTLKLQVLQTNPALRLYERLGFLRTGEDQMYIQMERRPD
jgi:ribosomal protein S18 acetylase RimI-like enzyme